MHFPALEAHSAPTHTMEQSKGFRTLRKGEGRICHFFSQLVRPIMAQHDRQPLAACTVALGTRCGRFVLPDQFPTLAGAEMVMRTGSTAPPRSFSQSTMPLL